MVSVVAGENVEAAWHERLRQHRQAVQQAVKRLVALLYKIYHFTALYIWQNRNIPYYITARKKIPTLSVI